MTVRACVSVCSLVARSNEFLSLTGRLLAKRRSNTETSSAFARLGRDGGRLDVDHSGGLSEPVTFLGRRRLTISTCRPRLATDDNGGTAVRRRPHPAAKDPPGDLRRESQLVPAWGTLARPRRPTRLRHPGRRRRPRRDPQRLRPRVVRPLCGCGNRSHRPSTWSVDRLAPAHDWLVPRCRGDAGRCNPGAVLGRDRAVAAADPVLRRGRPAGDQCVRPLRVPRDGLPVWPAARRPVGADCQDRHGDLWRPHRRRVLRPDDQREPDRRTERGQRPQPACGRARGCGLADPEPDRRVRPRH